MERIGDARALAQLLHRAQADRRHHMACLLEAVFAARNSDAQLRKMADMMLCQTQSRTVQLRRQRDGSARLDVIMTLREGIRLADAASQEGGGDLSLREREALHMAQQVVRDLCSGNAEEQLEALFLWLAEHTVYENLTPGKRGYAELTCASGALLNGRANCQGFADAYRLLCALGGFQAGYLCGWHGKGIHLLNCVEKDGRWYAADVSRASRWLRQGRNPQEAFLLDAAGCVKLGMRWPDWMKTEEFE